MISVVVLSVTPGSIAITCYDARLDVSILVTLKVSVVWDVTLCSHMCMDVSEELAASMSWWKKMLCMTSQKCVVGEIRRHAKNGVYGVSLRCVTEWVSLRRRFFTADYYGSKRFLENISTHLPDYMVS